MVKVRVLQRYFDREIGTYLEEKHEFEVDEKRAELLEKAGVAKIVKQTPKFQSTFPRGERQNATLKVHKMEFVK